MDVKKDREEFMAYLLTAGLSDTTIDHYFDWYRLFPKEETITQEVVNQYLSKHNNGVARAFLKLYLEHKGLHKIIDIPKRRGRKKKRIRDPVQREDIERMRKALYKINQLYGLAFDVLLYTAIRRFELVTISLMNFDWEEWGKDKTKALRLRLVGKGDKERDTYVPPELALKIQEYFKPLIDKKKVHMDSKFFPVTKEYVWKMLKKASEDYKIKMIPPHDIRRFSASNYYRQGYVDIFDLKQFLGHESISTTQLYIQKDRQESSDKFKNINEQQKIQW